MSNENLIPEETVVPEPSEPKTHPLLSNKQYDQLKWLTTLGLPGLGAFYFSLSQLWALPKGAEIVGTIATLATFLGILLKVSTRTYNESEEKYDGSIDVSLKEDGTKLFSLGLNAHPDDLEKMEQVVFKVNK